MRIAVTSQNFRTVTGHAGRARRFMIFEVDGRGDADLVERLDLPKALSMHEHPHGEPHPIDGVDVLLTGGCGAGFVQRMAARGVRVVTTSLEDPVIAVAALVAQGGLAAGSAIGIDGDGQGAAEGGCSCGHHDHGHDHDDQD